MRQLQEIIFNAGNVAGNLTGNTIWAGQLFAVSAQSSVTGTVAGTMKFQFSNDVVAPGVAPTNWSDIPNATVAISNTALYAIAKTDLCYNYIRLVYVSTSGSGTMTASINAQGV